MISRARQEALEMAREEPGQGKGVSYQWLAVIAVTMGAFMTVLNNSLINVALPTLIQLFNTTIGQAQWVLTGYMLTLGIVIPVSGYLGAYLGTRKLYLLALVVFVLGSVLGSIAWSIQSLILARVVQAMGAGMIIPVSMTIIYQTVPLEQRGTAIGLWGVAAMSAPAIGPTLSGYVVEYLSWHYLFLINIPVGLLALIIGAWLLKESTVQRGRSFDAVGFAAAALGTFALLFGLNQVTVRGWSSALVWSLLGLAVVMLGYFVRWELRREQPLLDLRVFKIKGFRYSVVVNAVITFGMFGQVFLIPIFAQEALDLSPVQTGYLLLPAALLQAFMQPISGRLLDRNGPRYLVVGGLILIVGATFALSNVSTATPLVFLTVALAFRGLGIGLSTMTSTTAGLNTVRTEQVGEASALTNTIRQVSASAGLVLLTLVYELLFDYHLDVLLLQSLGGLEAAKQARALAVGDAFLLIALLTVLILPLAWRIKQD